MSKGRNKKTDEEKQCKKKELDRARKKTSINIRVSEVEGAVVFVRTKERRRVGCFSAGQVRTPACYVFHSMF